MERKRNKGRRMWTREREIKKENVGERKRVYDAWK